MPEMNLFVDTPAFLAILDADFRRQGFTCRP